jgi:hypothetical protein
MKPYGIVIMEVELHTFLPLALDGSVGFRAWTLYPSYLMNVRLDGTWSQSGSFP